MLELLDAVRERYAIPTQTCVLAHVTTTLLAIERGAPVDLVFQSIGGTEAVNRSFGVSLALLREAREAALSLAARHGRRQRACISRPARAAPSRPMPTTASTSRPSRRGPMPWRGHFDPLLVNTVVGFIGPEYLFDGKQITRAGLEDHFCGKLLGLPMGVDVCYTNHAEADQDDMDALLTLLGVAGVTYIMGVPGADDVMLAYQSTSFHDGLYLRAALGRRPAPEFEAWMARDGHRGGERRRRAARPHGAGAGGAGDERSRPPGRSCAASPPPAWRSAAPATGCRPRRISISRKPMRGRGMRCIRRSTPRRWRRRWRRSACRWCASPARRRTAAPTCCAPISAGGCGRRTGTACRPRPAPSCSWWPTGSAPPACRRQAPALLAAAVPLLRRAGLAVAPIVVADQARVALGDAIGGAMGAAMVAVLIGERPGLTALDSLGAYLTWDPRRGRTDAERNCISNIRPGGLDPRSAAAKLAWLAGAALRLGATGVALKDEQPAAPLLPPC